MKTGNEDKSSAPATTTRKHRMRMGFVRFLFLVAFGLVGWRLVQVQLMPDPRYTAQDEGAFHVGYRDIVIPRGRILDREDRVLAREGRVPSLWANPSRIEEPRQYAASLAAMLDLDEKEIYGDLTRRNPNGDTEDEKMAFVWVKRRLTDREAEEVKDSGLLAKNKLVIQEEPDRVYPEGNLAAHVLGFVNRDGDGGAGLELQYNEHLKSVPGRLYARKDKEARLLRSRTLKYLPPTGGEDLYLTIDKTIQHAFERELEAVVERCNAEHAMGILMEPHSGAILAMAYVPTFDPNRFNEYPPEVYINRAIVDVFEPGSSFKVVTAAAALEHGLVTPDTPIDCEGGAFNPYGHRITDTHELDIEPFSTCFAQSSNIAIIKVAAMLGKERLAEWVQRFGFGQTTSRDFKGESAGMVYPIERWSRLSMGSLPMGHEIAVTVPQLARAYCVIANGGFLVEPYLVERALSREGIVTYEHDTSRRQRILSTETVETMKALCHRVVVDPEGTGRYVNIPEYRVGGKTGTALLPRPDGRGYDRERCDTVFAGFAPLNDPKICGVIVVHEPKNDLRYGGYVCGPVFKNVVRETLIAMNCPEDPVQGDVPEYEVVDGKVVKKASVASAGTQESEYRDPDVLEMSMDELLAPIEDEDLQPLLDGLELVAAETDPAYAGPTLPSLRGLTKSEACAQLVELGVDWDARGSGWVLYQEPVPGTPLRDVPVCRLTFSNKRVEAEDDAERDSDTVAL